MLESIGIPPHIINLDTNDVRCQSHVSTTLPLAKGPPHLPIPAEYTVGKPQAWLR